jgi:coenzyme F420-0:L-glutamate ligase/coenzyme F420-1:gamma-L-glutamate ligase
MERMRQPLVYTPLEGLPLVQAGDDLVSLLLTSTQMMGLTIQDGDIIIVAQKIVSKAEGRLVNLSEVEPTSRAIQLGDEIDKDPRLVELILRESHKVLRTRPGLVIVEHNLGFVCANAGIDHSNVCGTWGDPDDWVLLLPVDPDQSAAKLRAGLEALTGKHLGVLIIDSHGRAWRIGITGVTIGISGVPGVIDQRGVQDMFGYELRVTQIGAADELAAGASLLMGQAAEGIPAVHARGFPYSLREASMAELLRPEEQDLFR